MKIQQAIFASSDRGQIKGYQLLAKSAGIDRTIATELHRWSPSSVARDDPAIWTINYFPVSQDFVAVARTVLGGPEYSSRGGSQVVTVIAVLRNDQFVRYQNNAVLVCQTAMALGRLRLPADLQSRCLEPFELPARPFAENVKGQPAPDKKTLQPVVSRGSDSNVSLDNDAESSLLVEAARLVKQQKRIAIIGASSPRETVAKLIMRTPIDSRREFSFTTGLQPALHRPFQAHFLPESSPVLDQMLKSEGITLIQVPQPASCAW